MKCERCPVEEECHSVKAEFSLSIIEEYRERFRKALHKICPLKMTVELHVSMVTNEFVKYLKDARRFEGEK